MCALCLPLCIAAGVFAPVIVDVALGPKYHEAIGLIRILSAAGAVSCLANVLGISYIALKMQRPQVISNVLALAFNVGGNIFLAPRFGVVASAWLTLATELFVAVWAVIALRRKLDFGRVASLSAAALSANLVLIVVGLALLTWPAIGIPAALVSYLMALSALRGWPPGLNPVARIRRRPSRPRTISAVGD